jgi:uncharacterized protein YbcI
VIAPVSAPVRDDYGGGPMLERISRRMVQLHKDFYGKGPTRTKTYYQDDVVTVLMRGGFTAAEETLFQSGRGMAVKEQRTEFQGAMEERFMELIAEETGRPVIAFMSTSHQHPDLLAEMFLLAPTDMVGEGEQRDR